MYHTKIMCRTMKSRDIVIDRTPKRETHEGEEQFTFMARIGRICSIYAVRQLMEKRLEMQQELHIYIDLEKP